MKNSLKISSNFSIPWLGAFIVTCVFLETSVCGSSFERSIEQKNWGDCAYCMRLLTISNLYNILYQHKCFSASTDSHLGAEIETLTLHAKFYGKIAWLLLHNYIKEVVWSQFIYHIQISAILPSNKNIRMKFGRGSCSVNAGESLENLSLSFRRSEALDKEKNAVVFILFLYQPIKVLDRISKKLWSVGWFTGVLKHHDCASNGCKVAVVHITGAAEQPLGYFRGLWNPATHEQRLSYL